MSDILQLKIDANVVRQLGAELISSPEIAILELIKNSFDADATYCYIDIDPDYCETINENSYSGKISIRDDGCGMDRETINNSWLTISYSAKREAKFKGEKTKRERTFTGDKGLGRLGTMRLGDVCRIKTYTNPDNFGHSITFCWNDFQPGITLDKVNIQEVNLDAQLKTGSTIEIIGLCDKEYWKNPESLKRFQYALSAMISPYGHFNDFSVHLSIRGVGTELNKFTENLLSLSISEFEFILKEKKLTINGSIKLPFFEPQQTQDKKGVFERFVLKDSGKELFTFLTKRLSNFSQKLSVREKYYIDFNITLEFDEIDNSFTRFKPTYPGDFEGKIYSFRFDSAGLESGLEGISKLKDTKDLLKNLTGGVHLYRDGFKIGSRNDDWLGLSKEMTSGSGAYSLRPSNTAGYISLTFENNPELIDKSDRESLIENNAYLSFIVICEKIISEINKYLNSSRRAVIVFLEECNNTENEKPKTYSSEQAQSDLKNLTTQAKTIYKTKKSNFIINAAEFDKQSEIFKNQISESKQDLFADSKLISIVNSIEKNFNELQNLVKEMQTDQLQMLNDLANHDASVNILINNISSYKKQIASFYDHVAIGLSAQYLAHDANAQILHITEHTNSAIQRTKQLKIMDVPLTKYHLAIRSDAQTLSKTISTLHPLVRAQREELRELNICEEIESYISYISTFFTAQQTKISYSKTSDCRIILFNAGKLFQIVDNIVRNSEHWLNVYGKHHPNHEKTVYIDVDRYKVTIWDNGKGVRPGVETNLFDMFVTDKEHGQGLGLYIAKTLLEERSCFVSLLDERNEHARRYKFQITLHGAAV